MRGGNLVCVALTFIWAFLQLHAKLKKCLEFWNNEFKHSIQKQSTHKTVHITQPLNELNDFVD
jgi:hypothetical protein